MCNTKSGPNVTCGFWVTMTCQCRLIISFSKCTSLVGDVDNGEGYAVWGQGYLGNLCTFLLILLGT